MPRRVAIVGAGIGGLAAAHHLRALAAERGLALEVVILEASDRPGGALATERCEGALLEHGPDTLVTHKPAGLRLCERLGLGGRLVFKPAGPIDIMEDGHLLPLPAGFAFAVPTRVRPMLASPLLSWRGKLRALAEPWVKPRVSNAEDGARGEAADESVASYVRRRFGDELYRRMCEPVVGGLFMADTEELSLAANFPRFASRERERKAPPPPRPSAAAPAAATLEGGLGQIAVALVDGLPDGALRLGTRVQRIDLSEREGFVLQIQDGPSLAADAVLIALPAPAAAPLVADFDPALSLDLNRIAYASAVTVHLAWPRKSVERLPECHGFFVPRTSGSPVVAASFVSVKYPERVAADQVVVRVFLGGALHPGAIEAPDADLVEVSARILAPLLGVRRPPQWSRVWRLRSSMPQRRVGHPSLVRDIRKRLEEHPNLEVTGGPLGAYGLPDSISEGEEAAERVLAGLAGRDA